MHFILENAALGIEAASFSGVPTPKGRDARKDTAESPIRPSENAQKNKILIRSCESK